MDKKIKCPKCWVELPLFNEKGQHNFCPTISIGKNKIVEICIKCKMEEVVKKWENP
ncbi:MAG: hypothetical protein US31_C0003G0004 [Berkelbacteria bacterium GW2011_GWA1_36_9]|uniref:Uncharacterized protein n=1 Tax=Berkelbacteria bacterium GW2011_GWA1_36_9 TaxID=1618331 RepID=A0A0G0FXI3_9BACT|nr:MAG: hypothetical protein US31_C0003G0004 [Berkelbacteria bacterium GW2011_GWA1_36_9]